MIHDPHDFARVRYGVLGAAVLAWVLLLSGHTRVGSEGLQALLALCSGTGQPWQQAAWWRYLGLGGGLSEMALGPAMIVAMMAPLAMPVLALVWRSSLRRRRLRGLLLCLAAYFLVWWLAGLALEGLLLLLAGRGLDTRTGLPAAGGLLNAWIWQCSPWKQRSLNQCQRHPPLAAFGWRAEWDAFRLGLSHGMACVGSCWALMALTLLLPRGHLAGMAMAALIVYGERLEPPARPGWRWRTLGWPHLLGPWLRRTGRLALLDLQAEIMRWIDRARTGLDRARRFARPSGG